MTFCDAQFTQPASTWPVDRYPLEKPVADAFSDAEAPSSTRIWAVGPLMRAVADTLAARFNPVMVRGELSGFSRAASGHCYFSLKDESGQVRCAMFRRAADQLSFAPRDGQLVEAEGKLDVYGPRGDLQLIVERLKPAGQGALFEQFLRLKAKLETEGLFDMARKRALPAQPCGIAVVTSLGAAALRDVAATLRRRVPHLPVRIYPAQVQGAQAPSEISAALQRAYADFNAGEPFNVLLWCGAAVRWKTCGRSTMRLWSAWWRARRCLWCAAWATRPISPCPTSLLTCEPPHPPPLPSFARLPASSGLASLRTGTSG